MAAASIKGATWVSRDDAGTIAGRSRTGKKCRISSESLKLHSSPSRISLPAATGSPFSVSARVGSKSLTWYDPFARLSSSNTRFSAVFGTLDDRSRRSQLSEAPMRTLSSERISVCRSSPEEMWITRPVAIKSYKAVTSITIEYALDTTHSATKTPKNVSMPDVEFIDDCDRLVEL